MKNFLRINASVAAVAAAALFNINMPTVAMATTASTGTKPSSSPETSVARYESQVRRFKPEHGLAAANSNDVRQFVYEWFTRFEHASPVDYYLGHLDEQSMSLTFPGTPPFTNHAAFAGWYGNLLAQTVWNFHDLSALQVRQTGPKTFLVSFIVDWYGEVRADSPQLAGWQTRKDSVLYHRTLRQNWTVKAGDRLTIETLVVQPGNTPSPIVE